jgi:hypothetical protein
MTRLGSQRHKKKRVASCWLLSSSYHDARIHERQNYEDIDEGVESDCDTSSRAPVSASSFRTQRCINISSQKTNYKQLLLDILKGEKGVVEEDRTLMLLFVHTTVQKLPVEDSFRPSSRQGVFSCHLLPPAAPVMSFRVPFSSCGVGII